MSHSEYRSDSPRRTRGPDTSVVTRTSGRYRIDHPSIGDVVRDMHIPSGDLGPGDRVPDFELPTTDGGRFASDQFNGAGQHVLLVFGSLTCPVTESAGDGVRRLHARYGRLVRFVVVNVREAHPGADVAFATAGRGAMRHTWKAAPPFAAMIMLSRAFGFLPRSHRGLPTIFTMTTIVAAVVLIAVT